MSALGRCSKRNERYFSGSSSFAFACAGVAKIAAKIGAFSKVLGVAFAIMGAITVKDIGYTLINALIQGKGIDIGLKKTWFGLPYGLDASVC